MSELCAQNLIDISRAFEMSQWSKFFQGVPIILSNINSCIMILPVLERTPPSIGLEMKHHGTYAL